MESNRISGAASGNPANAPVLDRQTLTVLVTALKQHHVASDLKDELLEDIALEAFSEGKLNDFSWLEGRLASIKGEPVCPRV